MKRTLLFIACVLASVTMQAQEELDHNDYIPFVKSGKKWHVVRADFESGFHFDHYMMNEEVVKNGKAYMKMYRSEDDLTVVYDAGLLREENRKVYAFDSDMQKEVLVFDYSLNPGDTCETYSYDEQKVVSYKVLAVGDYTEGPEVAGEANGAATDSTAMRHRYLRKWTVCRTDDDSIQKTWIEGVGSLEGPLANCYESTPVSSQSCLAYVEYNDDAHYMPFSFCNEFGGVHGCNLPTGNEYFEDDWHHQLTYELEGNRLHVYGKVFTQCGPNNYAFFIEKPTDDSLVHKIEFAIIQEVEPLADCMALHATDFYVPGFNPAFNYIVVDNHGEEHPVVNKTPLKEYRPFIEEGKVWKVGVLNTGNPVQHVAYYYFDGDTVIDGKTCKQMMCQQYYGPDYPDYASISQLPSLSYVGAWYEKDRKVYTYDTINSRFTLMYDFSIEGNDTLLIDKNNEVLRYVIGQRKTGGIKGFKGVYRDVKLLEEGRRIYSPTWLEGVGSTDCPTVNVYTGYVDPAHFLMSCTIGDEVIYLNDGYEDGATPEVAEARRQRFDFTHTTKPRPKAPIYRGEGDQQAGTSAEMQPLYGEYDEKLLGIHLDPLDETYLVRITDESGKEVYRKTVDAGNIVALNIDISAYARGRYAVTVENSSESFTGVFDVQTTGIEVVSNNMEKVKDCRYYNLQGQRITTLRKGLNIVDGRKVFVR